MTPLGYVFISLGALLVCLAAGVVLSPANNKGVALKHVPSYIVRAPEDSPRCFTALVNGEESTICRVGRRGDERQ